MKLIITQFESIFFETDTNEMNGCTIQELVKYYRGLYSNKRRFVNRFTTPLREKLKSLEAINETYYKSCINFVDELEKQYSKSEPFTFREAFELTGREFQALVFSSINITDMINELGATRIKTDGIEVNHRQYDSEGNFLGTKEYHNVYETHEINGEKLGLNDKLYAVKCWCTSTNKEHWIWINDEHKDDPLSAIASTFVIHKNVIPHIKALKRQGDLLLVEMNEGEDVKPEGEMVPLTKEQYFGLLVAQS